ncbi:MAG: hypothetical protein M9906_14860 [Microthrixaceae bacterium]|nr:hypothetical protein [Microthrixaceae bacterium]
MDDELLEHATSERCRSDLRQPFAVATELDCQAGDVRAKVGRTERQVRRPPNAGWRIDA